jgi:SAM-dependent methyltransferase
LKASLPFSLPAPAGVSGEVRWNGTEFEVAGRRERVICYAGGSGNWTDELTSFHEEVAGDSHYIDRASRRFTVESILRWVKSPAPVIIDIGCSSGFLLDELRRAKSDAVLVGADYVRGPLEALGQRRPGLPLLQFDLTKCPLPAGSFDAAVLLNVLEHIEDDRRAAEQVFRILKPGAIAVIEVPAGPGLFDIYDRQLMHFRRYKMSALTALLAGAGFEIAQRSHLGFFLYPGFWFVKKRNQRWMNAPAEVQRKIVAANVETQRNSPIFGALMNIEAAMRRYVYYPFGIRCLVIARKPA